MIDLDRRTFLGMAVATTGGFLGLRDAVAANLFLMVVVLVVVLVVLVVLAIFVVV